MSFSVEGVWPDISVIMPAFNSAATIGRALDSIRAQRVPCRETIVVDDASPDGTAEVVAKAAAGFPHPLKLIRLPFNSGPAAARNKGIAQARGEWVAFLDDDDVWLSGRLQTQCALAAERPDVVMWCSRTIGLDDPEPPLVAPGRGQLTPLTLDDFTDRNPVATSTVLVRRNAVEAVGGFDESFRGPEDYDLWMRIAAKHPLCRIETPLARYRYSSDSLSMDDRKFLQQVLRLLDKAYGRGGVLHGRPGKRHAKGYQYLCASWSASARGAPGTALRHLAMSLWFWPFRYRNPNVTRWGRMRLLSRLFRFRV